MTTRPRILVTGATGKTGGATAVALCKRQDVQVRAMVRRDDSRASALRQLGAEVVLGNLDDIRDVRRAMKDVQRAYFVAPWSLNSLDHGLNFAVAAAENRLEHVVALGQWLSSATHPSVPTRRTWLTDRFMSWIPNVSHTLINVGWFADNTMPLLGVAAQLGVFPFPLGAGRNAPVSNEDIGRVVAETLVNPLPYAGQSLRPTGPASLSAADIARIYGEVLGRPVKHQDISMKMFQKALRAMNLVDPLLAAQLVLYTTEYRSGTFEAGGPTDVVQRTTGRPAEDFETITRRYVAADPLTQRSVRNRLKALWTMLKIALTPAPNTDALERAAGWPRIENAELCSGNDVWMASHGVGSHAAHQANQAPTAA